MSAESVRITITGAAGQIGYALLFRIAAGEMFGPDTQVHLNLLELEGALDALEGVRMELDDCAFPQLASIETTSDPEVAFGDSDWAVLVGAVPRKKGMERSDLLNINGSIFTVQGKAIRAAAKPGCRVLVVGNPCNTNALICHHASGLPARQIHAMTMLDQNRAVAQVAQKAGVAVSEVKNLVIWGNHSPTMYPDVYNATIGGRPAADAIGDDDWIRGDFMRVVQQRGAAIIEARGASSAASAAYAALKTVRELSNATPAGECFSVCLPSAGEYDVPEGLIFGFPVSSDGQGREVVQGLEHGEFSQEKIKATTDELVKERDAVSKLLK